MSSEAVRDARKALNRLRRAVKKSMREMDDLEGAIGRAEGADVPAAEYERVRGLMEEVVAFTEEEGRRLQEKVLLSGGLEPGRIRRNSSLD